MAKARKIPGLEPQTRFGDAAAAAVEVRAAEVFAHSGGVLDTGDIERVHDMRVATRRLRAAMEIFAKCFPKTDHRQALREVKRLADALGKRRDPDVAIAALEEIASELSEDERAGVAGVVEELRAEQLLANEALAGALEAVEDNGLAGRLHALAQEARRDAPA